MNPLFVPPTECPEGPDDPEGAHHVWRYYLRDASGEWVATVFLDDRGQLAIHSVYGPASFDWEDAAIDPRHTFAAHSEADDALILERLSRWHPATRHTVTAIVRTVFPLLRGKIRGELAREGRP